MFNFDYNSIKLKEVYIKRDKKKHFPDEYYICAKYEEETDTRIIERVITAPLYISHYPTINIENSYGEELVTVNLGFGYLENAQFETKVIEEKEKGMTIEEIEKILGHKIKIVKEH